MYVTKPAHQHSSTSNIQTLRSIKNALSAAALVCATQRTTYFHSKYVINVSAEGEACFQKKGVGVGEWCEGM
jgi:ribonuclease HI